MEDVPGVGKTTLAVAFSKALGLEQREYSSPLILWLPTSQAIRLLTDRRRALLFHSGAAMTNILLADEINRTSGKTQSALFGGHGGAGLHS